MADPVTVVGLASAIVQLADFSVKVVRRLHEYLDTIKDGSDCRKVLHARLPLLMDALDRTKQQAEDGRMSEQTAKALKPSLDRCRDQCLYLEGILAKESPLPNDSKVERTLKAMRSLVHDKDIQKVVLELGSLEQTLILHNVAGGSTQLTSPAIPTSPQEIEPQCGMSCAKVVKRKSPLLALEPGQMPRFTVRVPREENFIGREDIIAKIDERVMEGQHRVAIAGMGGVGKSQIAIEYCYRYKEAHPEANVFWIFCSNLNRFSAAYQEIARELSLPGRDKPNVDTFELVSGWLNCEANGPWLLVLDNADDIETMFGCEAGQEASTGLVDHLPHSSRGAMIMTTRDMRVGERFSKLERPISVLPYGTEDAKRLLQGFLRDDHLNEGDAMALLEALDYLPLAISQAAAFMRENGVSLKSYLKLLEAGSLEAKALLAEAYSDPGRDPESQNSMFQTWKVSFESIKKQNPRATEILSLMAMLDRQAIPVRLLQRSSGDVDFFKAMGTLKSFSLITEDAEGLTVEMHRLVQLATQSWLELEGLLGQSQELTLTAMVDYLSSGLSHTAFLDINPHLKVVLGFVFTKEWYVVRKAFLLSQDALYDQHKGHFATALSKCETALSTSKEFVSEDSCFVMQVRHTLGQTLNLMANLDEAEEILQQLLVQRKRILGPDHTCTLATMDSLASVFAMQTKQTEQEALHRESLQRSERILGPAHLQTIERASYLAGVYDMQGRTELATAIRRKSLHAFEKELGPKHESTLWIQFLLATNIGGLDTAEVAESMVRQVLENYRETLGPEHPIYLCVLDGLTHVVVLQSRWAEAEVLAREVLDANDKLFSHDHPRTIWRNSTLAFILGQLGQFEAAEAMGQMVLDHLDKAFNSWTPLMLHRIGWTYAEQAKYDAAEAMHRRALEVRQHLFGSEHPFTLQSVSEVAHVLGKRKQFDQACALYQRASIGLQMTVGPKHSFTLECIAGFARLCRRHPNFSIRFPARFRNACGILSFVPITPSRCRKAMDKHWT